MLVVFLPKTLLGDIKTFLPGLEEKLRIRKGYRFRALAGFREEAFDVLNASVNQEQFSACILADAFVSKDSISNLVSGMKPKALERTAFYIDAPDKGNYYEGNGNAHMLLRDKDIQHEYRVRQGNGGFTWFMSGLPEIITFTSKRFHK